MPSSLVAQTPDALDARVARVLSRTPVIDGHNDLPWELRSRFSTKNGYVDLTKRSDTLSPPLHTDLPRLKAGGVGGQFWSVWVPGNLTGPEAVQTTLEQIDIVHRLAAAYPRDFMMAYAADDISRAQRTGRIASLIGVEGGHQINNSLGVLRQLYRAGARYLTLTHSVSTSWADSATADPKVGGLTAFGKAVVAEMNRIGMIVDLSHVSPDAMHDALDVASAPVIFSHSGARAIADHPRNVPDDVLKRVSRNGGVVMVNFYPGYVSQEVSGWDADRAAEQARVSSPPFGGLYIGQPERAKAALAAWEARNPRPEATLAQVADHIEHVARVAGNDHVGLGSDYDGIPTTPKELTGVQSFPLVLKELARRGWSDTDLAKLSGGNILRVMRAVEIEAQRRRSELPSQATIESLDGSARP
jgi:membrane dipeptidase